MSGTLGGLVPLQDVAPSGAIAKLLAENLGLSPQLANSSGSVVTFLLVFVAVYGLGRLIVVPLVSRVLAARDLDKHARNPLEKVASIVVVFVAVGVASRRPRPSPAP